MGAISNEGALDLGGESGRAGEARTWTRGGAQLCSRMNGACDIAFDTDNAYVLRVRV